jgi:hypothetical protein
LAVADNHTRPCDHRFSWNSSHSPYFFSQRGRARGVKT